MHWLKTRFCRVLCGCVNYRTLRRHNALAQRLLQETFITRRRRSRPEDCGDMAITQGGSPVDAGAQRTTFLLAGNHCSAAASGGGGGRTTRSCLEQHSG
ncbi:hypothetical protein NPIL_43921 [Nephila pilipes]|uniref:Uncharacterized protein n=1 Tax=Nephila pilipes TaxID=299642 RepID=A0A8X6JR14_NEPPI|nr:hypothetical protein NPIL_43921 [Nephila pilipes]